MCVHVTYTQYIQCTHIHTYIAYMHAPMPQNANGTLHTDMRACVHTYITLHTYIHRITSHHATSHCVALHNVHAYIHKIMHYAHYLTYVQTLQYILACIHARIHCITYTHAHITLHRITLNYITRLHTHLACTHAYIHTYIAYRHACTQYIFFTYAHTRT